MSENKTKALIKVNENSLKEIGKRTLPKIADATKRIAKTVGWGTMAGLGIYVMAVGNFPLAITRRNCRSDCISERNSICRLRNRTRFDICISNEKRRKENFSRSFNKYQ